MTIARREIVDATEPGVYHCVSRCVRRAFLCGFDSYSGRDFSHRKRWVRERIQLLAEVFGVELLTYAVMSNHLHIVLVVRPDMVQSWSAESVATRWRRVFKGTEKNESESAFDLELLVANQARIAELRSRLSSISWFMRCLNEYVARRSNHEDECKGRFWEGRFKCTRLLDEEAVITCMAYVDLNPVRAATVNSLRDPQFTGAYDRLEAMRGRERISRHLETESRFKDDRTSRVDSDSVSPSDRLRSGHLVLMQEKLEFEQKRSHKADHLVPFGCKGSPLERWKEADYMRLLDWSGRQLRPDRVGYIPGNVPPVLVDLEIDVQAWLVAMDEFDTWFARVLGRASSMMNAAHRIGQSWFRGIRHARLLFAT